jgi:hypothetical protein
MLSAELSAEKRGGFGNALSARHDDEADGAGDRSVIIARCRIGSASSAADDRSVASRWLLDATCKRSLVASDH